jgi:hypothetical protein
MLTQLAINRIANRRNAIRSSAWLIALAVMLVLNAISGGAQQRQRSSRHQPVNNRLRTKITWPEDCASVAVAQGEHNIANDCEQAIRAVKNWPNDCNFIYPDDLYNGQQPDLAVKFYLLSPGHFLGEFACSSGAYNVNNIYLYYDESQMPPRANLLEFPSYDLNSGSDLTQPVNQIMIAEVGGRVFNQQRKELIAFTKFRGMGDCGTFARYQFPQGQAAIKEFRAKTDCDGRFPYAALGKDPASPRNWRQIYP